MSTAKYSILPISQVYGNLPFNYHLRENILFSPTIQNAINLIN